MIWFLTNPPSAAAGGANTEAIGFLFGSFVVLVCIFIAVWRYIKEEDK